MSTVVILTPYGRTEVTAAAVRLAELVVRTGREVRLVACGTRERNVHPHWDEAVTSDANEGISRACFRADTVVHFGCHRAWFDAATLCDTTGQAARQVCVPDWHQLYDPAVQLLSQFDRVVCPSAACRALVRSRLPDDVVADRDFLTAAAWDCGLPPVRRTGTVRRNRISACVHCDSGVIEFCGPTILNLCHELLSCHPLLDLTLLSSRSWSKVDRTTLGRTAAHWKERLTIRTVKSWPDLEREFHQHDWAVLPAVRASYGVVAACALACGSPVVCHDLPPFTAHVTGSNGLLVPCEVKYSPTKAPIALPDLGSWVETCAAAFADGTRLAALQAGDWALDAVSGRFHKVWVRVLNALSAV